MRVDESPITLREIEKRDARREPSERELLLLFGVSFATIWATIFLLHRSTALVFAYGDNVAYRDVANAILHWDFRGLQLQRFMGYPYFIAFTNFAVADLAEKPLAALAPSSGLVGSCK